MRKTILLLMLCFCLLISGCAGKGDEPALGGISQTNQTTDAADETEDHGVVDETDSSESTQSQTVPSGSEKDEASSTQPPKDTTNTTIPSVTNPSEAPSTSENTTPPTGTTTTPSQETEPMAPPETTEPPETTAPPQDTPSSMTMQSYNGLNYWLYTPSNPTANMPLIVYLHGGSGKGEDLNLLTDVDGFPRYVKEGRIRCDAYIIFPQCPSGQKGWKTMGDKVKSLISYTCSTYNLNTNKVSLTGHSMGGTGTWTLALDNPELFYKIAPMSGSVTMSDSNLAKLSSVPVWAVVGDKDKIVSPDTSIAMIDTLKQNGANARITVLEGADHFAVPGLGYLGTDVVSWLIS